MSTAEEQAMGIERLTFEVEAAERNGFGSIQAIGVDEARYVLDALAVAKAKVTMASEALQQAYNEGYRAVSDGDDTAHRLGRVHGGMRYCTDKNCNWGRPALVGER